MPATRVAVLTLTLEPDPKRVPEVRHALTRWLLRAGMPSETRRVVELLASELLTRAIIHAEGDLAVEVFEQGECLRVEISGAMNVEPMRFRHVAAEADRRSDAIVSALSHSSGVIWEPSATTLWCEVNLGDR